MSRLIVLRSRGHEEIEWDPEAAEVGESDALEAAEKARETLEDERARGGAAFRVEGPDQPVQRLETFDPTAEQVIVLPAEVTAAAEEAAAGLRGGEILLAVANPVTARPLADLAVGLASGAKETKVTALKVVPFPLSVPLSVAQSYLERDGSDETPALRQVAEQSADADAQVETLLRAARGVPEGIVAVAEERPDVNLILLGWPGPRTLAPVSPSVSEEVLHEAPCDVALFLNRGLDEAERLLVPVIDSPHDPLALRLAQALARGDRASLVVLRVVSPGEDLEQRTEEAVLKELFDENFAAQDGRVSLRVDRSDSIPDAIVGEAQDGYDLLVMGAAPESFLPHWLFGAIPDAVAETAPCSVLLAKKHSAVQSSWLRRIAAWLQGASAVGT